jgi:hypothetical protein
MSGSVVFSAGLVLFGLAAAVSRLTRLTDLMAARAPTRDTRAADPFERAASPAPAAGEGRIPFPSRPKSQANVPPVAEVRAPVAPPPAMPAAMPAGEPHAPGQQPALSPSLAPSLRNPDLGFDEPPPKPPVTPASERSAPEPSLPPPPPLPSTFGKPAAPQMPPPPPPRPAPAMRPPQPNYFDTVWSGDAKVEPKTEAKTDAKPDIRPEPVEEEADFRPVPRFEAPETPPPKFEPTFEPSRPEPPKAAPPEPEKPAGEMHAVAVLKSGVVDGMAYTLYVDGSIEAELPDGTLRFASINALREHLEKGGG